MENELLKEIAELQYPDNHNYNPNNFEPDEKTALRIEHLKKNAPELWQGGHSLLELESNKGLLCFMLKDKFNQVVGSERATEYVNFCNKVKEHHNITNVTFFNQEFREVPFDRTYSVVYIGNAHHYYFFDCCKSFAPPLLWLRKLACLAEDYLILDGPLEITDPAVVKLSQEGSWSDSVKDTYTLKQFEKTLEPNFVKIRKKDNGLGRETVVFKRILPNMPHRIIDNLRHELIEKGIPIDCNPRRGPDSCFVYENRRYKFDLNPIPDTIMFILNYLRDWFPPIWEILEYKGARVGDVMEWVYGQHTDHKTALTFFLKLNRILGTVGLVQTDFEPYDVKENYWIKNVDIDMVRPITDLKVGGGELPIFELMRFKCNGIGMNPEETEFMLKNFQKKRVFDEILERDNYYVGT